MPDRFETSASERGTVCLPDRFETGISERGTVCQIVLKRICERKTQEVKKNAI